MAATKDRDQLLIERMLAPPPLEDARNSHDYWRRRRKRLPLYRRAARREAKEMSFFWEERVRAAERAQFEATPIGRFLAWLGISGYWFERAHFARKAVVWVAWTLVFRKLKIVAGSIAAVGLLFVLAVLALLVFAIAQLT